MALRMATPAKRANISTKTHPSSPSAAVARSPVLCRALHNTGRGASHHPQVTSTTPQATSAAAAAVATKTAQVPQKVNRPLTQRHERLRDPAKIGSRGSATVMVNDLGGAVSLATYMQLPVEQYYILDPSQIQLLQGNTFVLSVPKISMLGASLQPVITVEVRSEPDAVVLQATDCQLNATGIMGGLDEKFAMRFTTRLTWSSPQHPQPHLVLAPPQAQEQQHQRELNLLAAEQQHLRAQQQQQQQQQQPQANGSAAAAGSGAASSIRNGWQRLRQSTWPGSSSTSATTQHAAQLSEPLRGSITGSAVVDVWCEVIPPFNLMPREVLVGTCNTVISGLVNSLLPWFSRQLAADYQKWAIDAAYRAARAARSRPQQVQPDSRHA